MIRIARWWLLPLLWIACAPAFAVVRAWLEPERISFGQTTMLKVESDDSSARPDFSVLEQNFDLRGQSSGTQISIVNGRRTMRILYSVALDPKDVGIITIPALQFGAESTEPLQLTVVPASAGSAENGDDIFIETEITTTTPYVQQAVTYTVRLFYAIPLIDGAIETGTPENASLTQVGADRRSTRDVGGRRYNVFERDLLLVPEQSGALEMPPARFRGHAQNSDMNSFFGGAREISAAGKRTELSVRPRPANAPNPWLPSTALTLARNAIPESTRAGEPLMVEVTLTVDGATAAQLPALELPPIAGAQVFPEQPQSKDSVVAGQPVASLTRRFAIVPSREGTLEIPELRVGYWNTTRDRADSARLEAVSLKVEPGANLSPASIAPATSTVSTPGAISMVSPVSELGNSGNLRLWQVLSGVLALALLLAIVWGWQRGSAPAQAPTARVVGKLGPVSTTALKHALARSDLNDIAAALRDSISPAPGNLAQLCAQLADPAQVKAVDTLERMLWAPGVTAADRAALLPQLRAAFKDGVRLAKGSVAASSGILPPLYPQR